MAATDGLSDTDLGRALTLRAWEFDFFQAVRLLEAAQEEVAPVGEGDDPGAECVRFRSPASFAFPATDVLAARPDERRTELDVSFLGLTGVQGPLPRPYVQRVLDRLAVGDTAARDFLDIFHHRLLSLLYRTRKAHRPALSGGSVLGSRVGRYLLAAVGLGMEPLRGRSSEVPDRFLVARGGAFAAGQRTAPQLEGVLSEQFGRPVRVEQFEAGWSEIPEEQRTVLGPEEQRTVTGPDRQQTRVGPVGRNRRLGRDAVLGDRAWDQARGVRLSLEMGDLDELIGFLPPDGPRLMALRDTVDLYLGRTFAVTLVLTLDSRLVPEGAERLTAAWCDVPETAEPLTAEQRLEVRRSRWVNRLGRTSWLLDPVRGRGTAWDDYKAWPRREPHLLEVRLTDEDWRGAGWGRTVGPDPENRGAVA